MEACIVILIIQYGQSHNGCSWFIKFIVGTNCVVWCKPLHIESFEGSDLHTNQLAPLNNHIIYGDVFCVDEILLVLYNFII